MKNGVSGQVDLGRRDSGTNPRSPLQGSLSRMRPLRVYPVGVHHSLKLLFVLAVAAFAQNTRPRFENYPVSQSWSGTPAPIRLMTGAERTFRTRLMNAAKEPANFAGHYRFEIWGCGAECISGAIIDLETGNVFSPPLANEHSRALHFSVCQSAYEDSGVDFRVNSRLLVLRCGLNYSERLQTNVPDAYYFVWEGNKFKQILHIPGGRKS